jgi:hypothetical protein
MDVKRNFDCPLTEEPCTRRECKKAWCQEQHQANRAPHDLIVSVA